VKRPFATVVLVGAASLWACGSRTPLFVGDTVPGTEAEAGVLNAEASVDAAVVCTEGRFTLSVATAQLMLVLDRSGSMSFAVDGTVPDASGHLPRGVPSRWRALHDALQTTLTPLDSTLAMGAKFFPEVLTTDPNVAPPRDEECRTDQGVGLAPALGNVASILRTFDATYPRGGTPTAEAVRLAAARLQQERSVARTLVLATDGAPNCNGDLDVNQCVCTAPFQCSAVVDGRYSCLDDTRAISAIRDVYEGLKVPVYVVGIGGADRPEWLAVLDQMAIAGGRPRVSGTRHYNVQSGTELTQALRSIGDTIAKCTYLTPSSPTDPNAIVVEIDGEPVARDTTGTSGWDWVDRDFGTLAFSGDACVRASSGGAVVVGAVRCK
jgi:hypothetical protein